MKSAHVGFQCDECEFPAESAEKIESHMKKKQVEFQCEDCRYRIDKTDKMKNYRKKEHEEIEPEIEEETIEQRSEKMKGQDPPPPQNKRVSKE